MTLQWVVEKAAAFSAAGSDDALGVDSPAVSAFVISLIGNTPDHKFLRGIL
jgi:hypothetical protein